MEKSTATKTIKHPEVDSDSKTEPESKCSFDLDEDYAFTEGMDPVLDRYV